MGLQHVRHGRYASAITCTIYPMKPLAREPSFDFELLQRVDEGHLGRNRRALLWLLGLLLLLLASIVMLVIYLQTFEIEEEERQHIADTQWVEQGMQFHFRRLEDDLTALGRRVRETGDASRAAEPIHGGLLWTEPGVILAHGWLPHGEFKSPPQGVIRLLTDAAAHPANAQALNTMQDITQQLRRSTYAGPMLLADGKPGDVVWLAVPVFDRGKFAGDYLAALSMNAAVNSMVPAWFKKDHSLRLVNTDETPDRSAGRGGPYQAELNMPGANLALQVIPLTSQPPTVPRTFFAVALLFLLGMLISLYALRRDFVKRQRIEARLKAQVALRKAMENSVTTGLRAWNMEGKILYVNQAFCRLIGFEATELVGRSAPLPYWPKNREAELDLIHRNVIEQGTDPNGIEVTFQHRDGRLIDVLIHEAPLFSVDGEQLGWMSSVLDISERKQAERMAKQQQERLEASGRLVAVGEAASTLAHELNQPLGALSSFANGLLNRLRSGGITLEEVRPVVERMDRLADKAGRIIHRVNAFARRREMSRERLDLVAFLRWSLAQYPRQSQVRLELDLAADAGPIWIEGDALLLEHAVRNVVANAHYWAIQVDRPAQVKVALWVQDSVAGIVISDSGPGVSEEQKEQVFTAFFSASAGGMGMGLAICRSVLEAHHGRIDVGRDPELGGARFVLWLPLSEDTLPGKKGWHDTDTTPQQLDQSP